MSKPNTKIYGLSSGEETLCTGTIEEIAKEMNVKYHTIMFYKTKSYLKRVKKYPNARKLFYICEGDEE